MKINMINEYPPTKSTETKQLIKSFIDFISASLDIPRGFDLVITETFVS